VPPANFVGQQRTYALRWNVQDERQAMQRFGEPGPRFGLTPSAPKSTLETQTGQLTQMARI
jgi:hypothetical protein